jgi:hypothetical protein
LTTVSEYVECQKCKKLSGDDWSQCKGSCPKEDSPHYDLNAVREFGVSKYVELTHEEAVKRDRWASFVESDEEEPYF